MNADGTKRCHHCGERKGPTAFYSAPSRHDHLSSMCRRCDNQRRAARRRIRRAQTRQERAAQRDPAARERAVQEAAERRLDEFRQGWCGNCRNGQHGPDCAAAYFGPDCSCGCGVLGYRNPCGERDPSAPAPMDRVVA